MFGASGGGHKNRHLVAPELLAALETFPSFALSPEVLAMIRQAMASGMLPRPELTPEQKSVRLEERFISGPEGAPDVRVLIYTPPNLQAAANPVYMHIHGGGFVIGAPEQNDGSNRQIAFDVGCLVVSVSYRLAPDAVFPGALHDCFAALSWLHKQADALGVDRKRIAIGGESAGGGHAAALALYARDKMREGDDLPICLQVLDSPMIDDRTGSTTQPNPNGVFSWPPENNRYGWQALLGMAPGGPDTPKYAAPAREEDLSGLPPAFIAVGALDLFCDEDIDYARRLIHAGVPTELHVVPGAYHGWGIAGATPQLQSHMTLLRGALKRAFGA